MIRNMARTITSNLGRQLAALHTLADLLTEEFSQLMSRDPQSVSALELSIQDLMRQIAAERIGLKRALQEAQPGADRLKLITPLLPEEDRTAVEAYLADIDRSEQICAVQSAKNYELALALHDQSRDLLNFLRQELSPRATTTYTAQGRFPVAGQRAVLRRGAC